MTAQVADKAVMRGTYRIDSAERASVVHSARTWLVVPGLVEKMYLKTGDSALWQKQVPEELQL